MRILFSMFLVLIVVAGCKREPAPANETTVAREGAVFGRDPEADTSTSGARLNYPEDAVEAADGSIYVSDTHSHVIRRIKGGIVSVFAGTFESGYNGDGQRLDTKLNLPIALALTKDEQHLLFSDSGNLMLRKIDLATGEIRTFAGTPGGNSLPRNGAPALESPVGYVSTLKWDGSGNLWFPSTTTAPLEVNGGLYYITPAGYVMQKAVTVPGKFISVRDIYIGPDHIDFTRDDDYFRMYQDGTHHHVKLPSEHGKGIAPADDGLIVGSHTALYFLDNNLAIKPFVGAYANVSNVKKARNGYLVTDSDQGVLYRFDGLTPTQLTGTSPLTFGALVGIAKYGPTCLLILDNQRANIWLYDTVSETFSQWAGKGVQAWATAGVDKLDTAFYYPNSIAADAAGNVFIAEQHRIMKIAPNGKVSRFAGYEVDGDIDSADPTDARFRGIGGMAVDASGNLYVADTYNNKVRKIDSGGVVSTIAGTGGTGATRYGIQANQSALNRPGSILPLQDGSLLIADSWNNAVHKVGADGVIRPFAGEVKFTGYQGNGSYSGDGGAAAGAALNTPMGIALSEDGKIFIADQFNHRIRVVKPDGTIDTFAGEKQGFAPEGKLLNYPNGMQAVGGKLYVADSGNRLIVRYNLQ